MKLLRSIVRRSRNAAALLLVLAVLAPAEEVRAQETTGKPAPPAAPKKRTEPTSSEKRAFNAASKAFNDGFNDRVDQDLTEFASKFPDSPLLPQVHLLRAQAQFKLGKTREAKEALTATLAEAGELTDRYRFWIGECHVGQ